MTTFIQTIEADLVAAWGNIEAEVETDALILWGDFKTILTAMQPSQFVILSNLVKTALPEVLTGDIADIETAVMNAAGQEVTWLENLGSQTMQAIIGVIVAAEKKV